MKNKVKDLVKRLFYKMQYYRKRNMYIQGIRKLIKKEKDLPKLSEKQIEEIRALWGKYDPNLLLDWHRLLYAKTGNEDPVFLPETVFHQIIKEKMNEPVFASVWGDKGYLDCFIRGVKTVRSVVRNVSGRFLDEAFMLIDIDAAQKIIDQYEWLVVKPSTNTHTGNGVKLLTPPYDICAIAEEYCQNYVIQIPLRQHEEISKLNASSINTIRVNSVLMGTESHVMSAFIKVGQAGEFADNHGSERYFIGIKEDGTYCDYAIDHDLQKYDAIPSGYKFAGQKVPCFDAVKEAIERAHKSLPHFGFVYWDVSVNDAGEPVIVEANLRNPDTNIAQAACGPFFGSYTREILKYIDNRR